MEDLGRVGRHSVCGSDHILQKGGQLIVHTRVDMPGWEVRKYRRPQIIFEGQPYYIVRRDGTPQGDIRYFLEPWGEHFEDLPGTTIHYGEDYVHQRDLALRQAKQVRSRSRFLVALTPLIGFLFSATKMRLEQKYGVSARGATRLSLYLQGFLLLTVGVILTISILVVVLAPVYTGRPARLFNNTYLMIVILCLAPDLVMRYSSLSDEAVSPHGFYEWLIHRGS